MVNLSEAAQSTIPFESLGVTIDNLVRHPDTRTAEFTVVLSPRNLDWQPGDNGKSSLDLSLAAASLSSNRDFLASRVESLTITENNQDASGLARTEARLPVTIRIPRKTQSLRVVVQTSGNGRIGTVELDRKTIDSAQTQSRSYYLSHRSSQRLRLHFDRRYFLVTLEGASCRQIYYRP